MTESERDTSSAQIQSCDNSITSSDTVPQSPLILFGKLEARVGFAIDLKPHLPPIPIYGIVVNFAKGDDGKPLRRGAIIPAASADGLSLILPSFPEGGVLPSTVFMLQPRSKLRVPLGITITLDRYMQAEIVPDAPTLQDECVTVEVQLLSPGTHTDELHLTFINYGTVPVQIRAGESYARLIMHQRTYLHPTDAVKSREQY
jgi:hypothetical protein